ncbi:helix-turn-helix transcriptional regulator [Paraburkholderia sp. BCC1885]|uniref:helix-turn-helix transcriptional regulator n=1 Tax=Paraburkholderia sp. BCC1885 TaxID=2562669 RepID=UPI0011844D44|nr:AlpA family phage regulatory protein [Paraburkholderia sp. BCC1885]
MDNQDSGQLDRLNVRSASAEPPRGVDGYEERHQLVVAHPLPFRRTIRRPELRQLVPLADTTIYDMERRGEFPRRFNLTPRCVVWDLAEVEAWLAARRQASNADALKRAPSPDVRQRKRRPVKQAPAV